MKNEEIAKILFEIGEILEIEGVPFKPRAYQLAALAIDNLDENIEDIYEQEGLKGLDNIKSVGKNIAEKIEEYLKTGEIKYYKKIKKRSPVDVENLFKIEGLGPKKNKTII